MTGRTPRTLGRTRARLEPPVFAAEHDQGRAMTLAEAVGYALEGVSPDLRSGAQGQPDITPSAAE